MDVYFRRGQLGSGELESEEQPVLIEALAGIKVSTIYRECKFSSFFSKTLLIEFQIIDVAAGGWRRKKLSSIERYFFKLKIIFYILRLA